MAVAAIAVLISTLSANLQQHSTQYVIGSASLLAASILIPESAIAKNNLSNEVYGNDEAGVVLTCYDPDVKGIRGECQYYGLSLTTKIYFTTSAPAVRNLWQSSSGQCLRFSGVVVATEPHCEQLIAH